MEINGLLISMRQKKRFCPKPIEKRPIRLDSICNREAVMFEKSNYDA